MKNIEIGTIAGLKTIACKDGIKRNMVFGEQTATKVKNVWQVKGGNIASVDAGTFKQMKVGDKIMF